MRLLLATALVVLLVGPLACGSEDTGASGETGGTSGHAADASAEHGGAGGVRDAGGLEATEGRAGTDTSIDAPADVSIEAPPEAGDATSNDVTDATADQSVDAAPSDAPVPPMGMRR